MYQRAVSIVCAAGVVATMLMSGCAINSECRAGGKRPPGLTRHDLVGTYVHSDISITLKGDGEFTTQGWPTNVDGPVSRLGSGTWELTAPDDPDYSVSFAFRKITGFWNSEAKGGGYYGTGLYLGGSRKEPHLWEFVGDPDACDFVVYKRS